ncbi:unnamed protein product [Diamesa tonsa]
MNLLVMIVDEELAYAVVAVAAVVVAADDEIIAEGDACSRNHDNSPGICRKVEQCPKVRQEYNAGISLTICAYINRKPIVCCPTSADNVRPQSSNTNSNSNENISVQKCVEYAKHVKKEFTINALILNAEPHTVSVSQCDYSTALIVGGENTKLGEYPHMAAIAWRDLDGTLQFSCGGSLISERYVLTAAHCSSFQGRAPILVRLGDQNLKTRDDGAYEKDYEIEQFIKHESYSRKSRYYDIAVIRLAQEVTFTKFIRPACLWQSPNINQTKAVATGWGYTEAYGETSDELQKVSLDIIDNNKCNRITPQDKLSNGIIDSQICAGVLEGGKDTCQGDSGGPIQLRSKTNQCLYYVVGLTSRGSFCGTRTPSVYTRVSYYLDWIEQKVWNNSP